VRPGAENPTYPDPKTLTARLHVQLGLGQQWHKPDRVGPSIHHTGGAYLQPLQPAVAQPWEEPPPLPPPR
jgi:hypothetical protein